MSVSTPTEASAIQVDAELRVRELRAVAGRLWPDRDDPHVMSEYAVVEGQIRQAEQALADEPVR
jgi:hypothetical protein